MCKRSLILFAGLALLLAGACGEAKVTDPADPRFDIKKFRFMDYRSTDEIAEVLRVHFPVGTERSSIDETLVNNGAVIILNEGLYEKRPSHGTNINQHLEQMAANSFVRYQFTYKKPWFSPVVGGGVNMTSYFDKNDQLLFMVLLGRFVHLIEIGNATIEKGE